MSDDETKDIDIIDVTKISTDFNYEEELALEKFVEKDMPGLTSVEDDTIADLFSMYMKGKSYSELANSLKVKKPIILCLSKQHDWYNKKMNYLTNIQDNIESKLIQTKIESLNFLTDIVGVYHKVMAEKIVEGLAKGKKPDEFLDAKELTIYFRALEAIEKTMPKQPKDNQGNPMTVNIHGNAKTKVSSDGKTLEIESGDTGSILKALAELTKNNKKD